MAVIVPGPGRCSHVFRLDAGEDFVLLGPFAEGDWIERVDVTTSTTAANRIRFGMSLGGSGQANLESFQTGVSLIHRSTVEYRGKPSIEWESGGAEVCRFIIPVGVKVSSGARYIVCEVQGVAEATPYAATFSAKVVERVEGD